jgi:hypothetical protein
MTTYRIPLVIHEYNQRIEVGEVVVELDTPGLVISEMNADRKDPMVQFLLKHKEK